MNFKKNLRKSVAIFLVFALLMGLLPSLGITTTPLIAANPANLVLAEEFNYCDFGAVGDGIADDFDAIIATHAAANAFAVNNPGSAVIVTATDGKTYRIGATYLNPFDNSDTDRPVINPTPGPGLGMNAAQGRPSRARGNVFEFGFYDAAAARRDEGRAAIIQTNVNWGNANFIIDDTTLTIRDQNDDEHYGGGRHIFEVESSHRPIVITANGQDPTIHFGYPRQDFTGALHPDASTSFLMNTVSFLENRINIELDLTDPAYRITPGMTRFDLPASILQQLPPSGALVLAENNQLFQYGRTTGHPGFMQNEVFSIDRDGNILEDIIWDFQPTMIVLHPIDETTLTIEGGNFAARDNQLGGATQAGNARGYIMRGITVRRSNTVLDGINYVKTDQRPSASGGWRPSYRGFFSVSRTHNVRLQNIEAEALNQRSWGTYAFNFEFSTHLRLDNVIQTNFGTSGQPGGGTVWGIMGSDFTKDVTITNSRLNRYDAHLGVHNLKVFDSIIGSSGVNLVGSGLAHFSGVTFTGNSSMFTLRDDYGTRWDGDLLIEDSIYIPPNASPQIVGAFGGGTFRHLEDFGYSSHLPRNITVDGLTIKRNGGITNLDMFFNFIGPAYTGIPPQFPLGKPETIMLSDIYVAEADGSNPVPIDRSIVRVANMANDASTAFFSDVSIIWGDFFPVTFDTAGGQPENIQTQFIEDGQTAVRPTNPTRAGYHFAGWFLADSEFDFATPITGPTNLVARWLEVFTVSFDSDGGTSVAPQFIPYGSAASRPSNPSRFAFSFVNWYLETDPGFGGGTWGAPYDFGTVVTDNVNLRARWQSLGNIVEFRYIDFGAVGDATFDHITFAPTGVNTCEYFAIMATHLAANAHAAGNPGDFVIVTPGAPGLVFYFGEDSFMSPLVPPTPAMIPIKTDVNWGDAIFIIDNSLIVGAANASTTDVGFGAGRHQRDNIFRVEPTRRPIHITPSENAALLAQLNQNLDRFQKYVSVDGNNTILSTGVGPVVMGILAAAGVDFDGYDEIMIEVYDSTPGHDVYRRVDGPGNPPNGRPMNDRVVVGDDGEFISAGWIWDYQTITRVNIYPIDAETLTIQGGTFKTIENRWATGTGGRYIGRGLQIGRSNVLVYNVIHRMTNFLNANPSAGGAHGSSSYYGFFHIGDHNTTYANGPWFHAYNVELRDVQLAANTARAQGTYGIVAGYSVGITLNNVRQTDMWGNCNIQNGGPAGNTPAGHLRQFGVIDMDFVKDIIIKNGSRLNRFDAHMGSHNVSIIDSYIGFDGLNLVGGGTFNFINSTITGNSPFKLRPDFGTVWNGDMNIINSTINVSSADIAIITTWGAYHGQNFGSPSTLPRNTFMENITINRVNDVNSNNWQIVNNPLSRIRIFADFLPSTFNLATGRQLGKPLTLIIDGIGGTGVTSNAGNVFLANLAFPNNTNLFDLVDMIIDSATFHSVSFITQSTAIDARRVLSGTQTPRPEADPDRSGFNFTGWFADAETTIPFDFDNPITRNTVVWAGWDDASVWDINGPEGTIVVIDGRVYERMVVNMPSSGGHNLLTDNRGFELDGPWFAGINFDVGRVRPDIPHTGGNWAVQPPQNWTNVRTINLPEGAILESIRYYWNATPLNGSITFESANNPAVVIGTDRVGTGGTVPIRKPSGWRNVSETVTMTIYNEGPGATWQAYILEFTYLRFLYDINSPAGTIVELNGAEYEHVVVNFNNNGAAVTHDQLRYGWLGMTFEFPTGANSNWAPGIPAARNQYLGQIAPNVHNVGWSVAPAPHQFHDPRIITLPDGAILTGIRYYWNNWWNHNGHVEFSSELNPNAIATSTFVREPGVGGIDLDVYVPRLATGWVNPSPIFTADFYHRGNGASRQIYILEFTYLVPVQHSTPSEFSWDIFNNGEGGSPSRPNASLAAAGLIRMWTQLDSVGAPVYLAAADTIVALDQDENCAMEFVTVNRVWVDGQGWADYFVSVDVNKNGQWQYINLSITVFGQTVNALLVNAQFEEPAEYATVTFVVEAGAVGVYAATTTTVVAPAGEEVPASAIPSTQARTGFYFAGWYPSDPAGYVVTEDITFTARFNPLFHYVTFEAGHGGQLVAADGFGLVIRIRDGFTFWPDRVPTPAANEGYAFVEWYPANPAGFVVRDNMTFTAVFAEAAPTIPLIVSVAPNPAVVEQGGAVELVITTQGMPDGAWVDLNVAWRPGLTVVGGPRFYIVDNQAIITVAAAENARIGRDGLSVAARVAGDWGSVIIIDHYAFVIEVI